MKNAVMKTGLVQKIIMVASAAVLILCALIFWTLSQETSSPKERVICSSSSADGAYQVEIVAYGDPVSFGAQRIGIKVGEYGDTIYTRIGNDGATVDEGNFAISWDNNVAMVVVLGSEQKPVTYRIAFDGQGDYYLDKRTALGIPGDGSYVLTE